METVGALLTVTGRALATTDVITLQAGTTCPTTGGSIALTSGASVGGVAGARTLTASTATVSTLVPVGTYSVCGLFSSTSTHVKIGSTEISGGESSAPFIWEGGLWWWWCG